MMISPETRSTMRAVHSTTHGGEEQVLPIDRCRAHDDRVHPLQAAHCCGIALGVVSDGKTLLLPAADRSVNVPAPRNGTSTALPPAPPK